MYMNISGIQLEHVLQKSDTQCQLSRLDTGAGSTFSSEYGSYCIIVLD